MQRPWILKTRKQYFGDEYDPNNLEPWVTAVCWSDGAICELAGVLHPTFTCEAEDDKHGIIRMKQNKSRT